MHAYMMGQLAADRVAELRADAQRARQERARRPQRASEPGQSLIRREWRVLIHALLAR